MKKRFLVLLSLFLLPLTLVGCKNEGKTSTVVDDYKLSIAAPSGAPLISLARAVEGKDYTLNLNLAPAALQPLFVKGETDVIVAPINLGATVYNKLNQNYQLASVLTWGNLFIASQDDKLTSLSYLDGKDVILFGENTINDVVVKYVFNQKNIHPNITYLGDTNLTQAELIKSSEAIVLIAEPALSAAKTNLAKSSKSVSSISIQTEFEAVSNNKKFTQAGCFVKKETATNHKSVVDKFLADLKISSTINTAEEIEEAATKVGTLGLATPKPVLVKAIPNCNISYLSAKDSKALVEFSANLNLALFGGKLPDDGFYYA